MEPFVSTQKRTDAAEAAPSVRAVRPRALATALFVIAASVLWDEWTAYYVRGSQLSRSHFPMAFFFPFLTVTVLSRLVERLWPGQGLTRPELLVILGAGLAAISVPYDGVMGHLIGILAAPFYFASPENGWELYLHGYIPAWLVPQNAGGAMAWYFEGAPDGKAPALGMWGTPLFWWVCLLGAMGFAVFCLVVMLRKQWMEHERLAYPLVEVGRMLTEMPAGGRWPAFFRSPLFWLGFGLVMGLKMWNVVSYFSPSFPVIPFEGGQFQLFPDFPRWIRRVSFYAVGFGYFAPLDVLFSVWFFVLATAFEVFAFNRFGHNLGSAVVQWQSEALGWQSLGALLFLAGWSLWMARRHLREVWRRAFSPDGGADDSRELLSYRTAAFGLLGSLLFAGAWLYAAGMELFVVAMFLPVTLLTFLGLSRVVAELGLVYAYYQVQPYDAVLQALGSRMMGLWGGIELRWRDRILRGSGVYEGEVWRVLRSEVGGEGDALVVTGGLPEGDALKGATAIVRFGDGSTLGYRLTGVRRVNGETRLMIEDDPGISVDGEGMRFLFCPRREIPGQVTCWIRSAAFARPGE